MYHDPIVSQEFNVPLLKKTARCLFRPLTIRDVIRDFDAVMSSAEYLKEHFNPSSSWPEGLTVERNLVDLGWHEYEFQNRTSFTYTITDTEDELTLGCCYIYPSKLKNHDVSVSHWVRDSERETGLNQHIADTLKNWITKEWPFKSPLYIETL